ncbi:cytochrome P450 [Streptomyces sp. NPDC048281]|uniref:cytochrome P450 n=1 Tax=Streptomyces sp. NPDC048281 TaxID=3154715 RepID=UPI00343CA9C7
MNHRADLVGRDIGTETHQAAGDELSACLGELPVRKEHDPADDLLSRQLLRQREHGKVDHEGLVDLAFLLLLAGFETTANMISLCIVALLESSGVLDVIRRDPIRRPDAMEELLRLLTVAEVATARVAAEDVEIGGVLVRAGEGVFGLAHAANHDPAVFHRPDELDIERGGGHPLAFGTGPHRCLGQALARTELRIVVDTLFRRIPGLRLESAVEELLFNDDPIAYGLYQLPVIW